MLMAFRLTLTGVGAMNSPRFAPAGLLIEYDGQRVMVDGAADSVPAGLSLDTWLVTDDRAELIRQIRRSAEERGIAARVSSFSFRGMRLDPLPVVHTSHATFGYSIQARRRRIVWAPEFYEFPEWAERCDLMFAEAAGWNHPIHFAGKVGGHAAALTVARQASDRRVQRLVFAHIGRPTIRAMDRGDRPPFGFFGYDSARLSPDAGADDDVSRNGSMCRRRSPSNVPVRPPNPVVDDS